MYKNAHKTTQKCTKMTRKSVYFCYGKWVKSISSDQKSLLLLGEEPPQGEADHEHDYEPEKKGHERIIE